MKNFTLSGRVASLGTGSVQGIARIVTSELELDKIKQGDIMVTMQTDINFVPALELCVGLVTEQGGRFCHAAIYSRENELPCIVGVDGVMEHVEDGMIIVLDTANNAIKTVEA